MALFSNHIFLRLLLLLNVCLVDDLAQSDGIAIWLAGGTLQQVFTREALRNW